MSETAPISVFLLSFARRGEENAVESARDTLRERYPNARLQAIGTPTSEPMLRALGLDQVLLYTHGSARRVLEEAQLSMPEAGAIVYGGDDFRGHLKLELLAYALGTPIVLRCRANHPPRELGAWHLAGVIALKGAHAFARVAAGCCVAALACLWLCRPGGGPHARRD